MDIQKKDRIKRVGKLFLLGAILFPVAIVLGVEFSGPSKEMIKPVEKKSITDDPLFKCRLDATVYETVRLALADGYTIQGAKSVVDGKVRKLTATWSVIDRENVEVVADAEIEDLTTNFTVEHLKEEVDSTVLALAVVSDINDCFNKYHVKYGARDLATLWQYSKN